MDVDHTRLSRLIARIYECALDDDAWIEALSQLTAFFDARLAAVLVTAPAHRGISESSGISPEMRATYVEHYGSLDPVAAAFVDMRPGVVLAGEEILDPRDWRRHEFYSDFAKPWGVGDYIAATLSRTRSAVGWLVLAGPTDARDYTSRTRLSAASEVVPHLQQATRVRLRLSQARITAQRSLEALSRVSHGVVLLSRKRQVVFRNEAAAMHLGGDGLRVGHGRELESLDARENERLRHLIAEATDDERGEPRRGGSILISRPSMRRPYLLHVIPLGESAQDGERTAVAMVLIVDLSIVPEPPADVLHRLFGFTRAEVAVALAVMRGQGLQAVADQLCVSLSTVRVHLQHAFEKTDTHRQVELTALLLALQAGFDSVPG